MATYSVPTRCATCPPHAPMAYTRFDSGAVAHYIDDPDICADDSDSLPDLIADSGAPFESNALVLRGPRELSHTGGCDVTRSGPSFWNQLIGGTHISVFVLDSLVPKGRIAQSVLCSMEP
jgi:hypothetical protein